MDTSVFMVTNLCHTRHEPGTPADLRCTDHLHHHHACKHWFECTLSNEGHVSQLPQSHLSLPSHRIDDVVAPGTGMPATDQPEAMQFAPVQLEDPDALEDLDLDERYADDPDPLPMAQVPEGAAADDEQLAAGTVSVTASSIKDALKYLSSWFHLVPDAELVLHPGWPVRMLALGNEMKQRTHLQQLGGAAPAPAPAPLGRGRHAHKPMAQPVAARVQALKRTQQALSTAGMEWSRKKVKTAAAKSAFPNRAGMAAAGVRLLARKQLPQAKPKPVVTGIVPMQVQQVQPDAVDRRATLQPQQQQSGPSNQHALARLAGQVPSIGLAKQGQPNLFWMCVNSSKL